MRARPRQHTRHTRRGPVIINRGVPTRAHKRYVGFGEREKDMLNKSFDTDPRLKFKRDKTVKDIIMSGRDPLGLVRPLSGIYSQKEKRHGVGIVWLRPKAFKSQDDLNETLNHEITHASHDRKVGLNVKNEAYDAKELVGLRTEKYGDILTDEDKDELSYLSDPTERLAYKETGGLSGKTRIKNADFLMTSIDPHLSAEVADKERDFKENLQVAPKLRDFSDRWRK